LNHLKMLEVLKSTRGRQSVLECVGAHRSPHTLLAWQWERVIQAVKSSFCFSWKSILQNGNLLPYRIRSKRDKLSNENKYKNFKRVQVVLEITHICRTNSPCKIQRNNSAHKSHFIIQIPHFLSTQIKQPAWKCSCRYLP